MRTPGVRGDGSRDGNRDRARGRDGVRPLSETRLLAILVILVPYRNHGHTPKMDVFEHNRRAWTLEVEHGNRWTLPVSAEAVDRARGGDVEILLTPLRRVPADWLGDLRGRRILALASGGGQQGPLLAAAGAQVTVFDACPAQLAQDRAVAAREGLELVTVEGDMADLGAFVDGAFDLIIHPVSNCFVPDVLPVWLEAARVLAPGGELLAGFCNPVIYLFEDEDGFDGDDLVVRNTLPYADPDHASVRRRLALEAGEPAEFGHTLADQLGGQLAAGLILTGFYEDIYPPANDPLSRHTATFIATRARKHG